VHDWLSKQHIDLALNDDIEEVTHVALADDRLFSDRYAGSHEGGNVHDFEFLRLAEDVELADHIEEEEVEHLVVQVGVQKLEEALHALLHFLNLHRLVHVRHDLALQLGWERVELEGEEHVVEQLLQVLLLVLGLLHFGSDTSEDH